MRCKVTPEFIKNEAKRVMELLAHRNASFDIDDLILDEDNKAVVAQWPVNLDE